MPTKSAAAHAVVSQMPGARREPPPELTTEEAQVWRRIVAARPGDWFDSGATAILVQHCRHAVTADLLAKRIAAFTAEDLEDAGRLATYRRLLALRAAETQQVVSTARQLRLTPQSLMRREVAATRARDAAPGGQRPWEFDSTS